MKTLQTKNKYYEELGKISSNILHDIINPITGLVLYLDMINDGKDSDLKNFLIPIKDTSGTIREFIKYIDSHLNNPNEIQIINLDKLIKNTMNLFKPKTLKNKVSFYYFNQSSRNLVIGNPLKLFQVLINIISNAIDSFENDQADRKNIINIFTSFVENTIKLTISDNGCGIKKENQINFFSGGLSTKDTGCGIGIKSSHQIIRKDFESELSFKSEEKIGTSFEIVFSPKRVLNSD